MIQQICRIVLTGLLAGMILLAGCEQAEVERLTSGGDDNNISGKLATLNISLQGIPAYNAPDGQTRSSGSSEPLIAEWVAVNFFDATRPVDKSGEDATDEKTEEPRIALMELREDTVSSRPATRSVMAPGVYFRLIVFRKTGAGYVFQSVADYTSNGSSTPVFQQGQMNLPIGGTYRFAAYSFNNNVSIGSLPSGYTWGGTPITIPNLSNDFLTFVSGDQKVTDENCYLSVTFTHQLCQLTVRINPINFDYSTFTNCTGVYISQGGNSSSWTVGQDGIAANMNNSASFNINDNSTATVRLVPFASSRPVAVHFGTLTVGGIPASNLDITSSQPVLLVRGRSYTLTAQIKYAPPGIRVPESEIKLGDRTICRQQDRDDLSKLRWAEGNLKSDGNGSINDYVWTTPTDYGYCYTFYSTYTGNYNYNGTDPCSKLNPAIYGSGWRTPKRFEFEELTRCREHLMVDNNGIHGMWFMNKPNGLFLPAAGAANGSSLGCYGKLWTEGHYWSDETANLTNAYSLDFYPDNAEVWYHESMSNGLSVRCVKREK